MDIGWTAVGADLDGAPTGETITELCDRIAQTFLTAVGASSGPLYASAFRSAGPPYRTGSISMARRWPHGLAP